MNRSGRRGPWALRALVALGLVAVVVGAWRAARRAPGGRTLGAGAAVVREERRVATIERVLPGRRGRLPQYLAPAAGAVVDSLRLGVLAARLEPGAAPDAPVVTLVPREAVRGLSPVGRLVLNPGEGGLLVFGAVAGR